MYAQVARTQRQTNTNARSLRTGNGKPSAWVSITVHGMEAIPHVGGCRALGHIGKYDKKNQNARQAYTSQLLSKYQQNQGQKFITQMASVEWIERASKRHKI